MFKAKCFTVFFLALALAACSSTSEKTNNAEAQFKLGEKLEKDERFEEALSTFGELKNKYPYSQFATEAELRIADIQFKKDNFIEAEAAYKTFKELHPNHPRTDYVTFRIALSLFNQAPSTIDRDLEMAEKSVMYFDQAINNYPGSEYIGEAKEKKDKVLKMLAQKELYIADFYFKKEKYDSALGRYQDALKKYPQRGYDSYALFRSSLSALKIQEMAAAKRYYERLLADFPNTSEAEKARKEIGPKLK